MRRWMVLLLEKQYRLQKADASQSLYLRSETSCVNIDGPAGFLRQLPPEAGQPADPLLFRAHDHVERRGLAGLCRAGVLPDRSAKQAGFPAERSRRARIFQHGVMRCTRNSSITDAVKEGHERIARVGPRQISSSKSLVEWITEASGVQ